LFVSRSIAKPDAIDYDNLMDKYGDK